jgi:hypothetical protein
MRKWTALAVGLATLLAPCASWGDEQALFAPRRHVAVKTEIVSSCRVAWRCGRFGCEWHKVCPRRCPERYLCHSLYGAYGPYGGVGYWSRYTGGWPYR